ncbi:MAG: hypothetical protein L0H63_14465 [Nitrococcus sp.]|nr:hypothetical protein [Nitrococcus sp.]
MYLKPTLDPLDAFSQPIVADVLVGDIAIELSRIPSLTGAAGFKAGQPLFYLASVVFDRGDISADGAQVYED